MAVITSFYTMDGKEGVDLNVVQTSVTTTDPVVPAARAKLGDRVQGNGGSEWIFVRASTTVTAYNVIAISKDYAAETLTETLAKAGVSIFGIAEFPPNQLGATVSIGNANGGVANPGDYFWAALKIAAGGKVNCAVTAASGGQTKLYVSGLIAGSLTSAISTSVPQMQGIIIVETLTTISVPFSAECIMQSYMVAVTSI